MLRHAPIVCTTAMSNVDNLCSSRDPLDRAARSRALCVGVRASDCTQELRPAPHPPWHLDTDAAPRMLPPSRTPRPYPSPRSLSSLALLALSSLSPRSLLARSSLALLARSPPNTPPPLPVLNPPAGAASGALRCASGSLGRACALVLLLALLAHVIPILVVRIVYREATRCKGRVAISACAIPAGGGV